MEIKALGPLKPSEDGDNWLESVPIAIPILKNQKLKFSILATPDTERLGMSLETYESNVNKAVEAFLKLGLKSRLKAAKYIYKEYREARYMLSKEDVGCKMRSYAEVWKHITPTEVSVMTMSLLLHSNNRSIYVAICCECPWDPEHGVHIEYPIRKLLARR